MFDSATQGASSVEGHVPLYKAGCDPDERLDCPNRGSWLYPVPAEIYGAMKNEQPPADPRGSRWQTWKATTGVLVDITVVVKAVIGTIAQLLDLLR
jgi:hypothetical protein